MDIPFEVDSEIEQTTSQEDVPMSYDDGSEGELFGITENGKFSCRICAQLFKTKVNCINHLSQFHEKFVTYDDEPAVHDYNECPHCGATFKWKKNLFKHIRSSHNVEPEPIEEVKEEGPFACLSCHFEFTSISNLNRHCRLKHSEDKKSATDAKGAKPVFCPMCNQKFCGEASLQCHTRVFHKIVVVSSGSNHNRKMRKKFFQFECNLCHLKINKRFNMNRHIMAVHDAEPDDTNISVLVSYEENEINEPFKCDECEEDFELESSWDSHIRNVHNMQPETCCNRCGPHSFQSIKDLRAHLKDEHGVTPMVIDEDRQFVRLHRSNLGLQDTEIHALAKIPDWLVKRANGQLVVAVYRS